MIVVTGATGTIGAELVRLLSGAGAAVRALSRHPTDAPDLDGVEWVAADLADPASLAGPMCGAERLFLLTGNTDDMVRLQRDAIEAATAASGRCPTATGSLSDFATDHREQFFPAGSNEAAVQ